MPIPASIHDHYGIPPETYWRDHYFAVEPDYFGIQIDTAKRLLDFTPGMKALDIGAGLGKTMVALDRAGFATWGIEPSVPFRNKALEMNGISAERLQNAKVEEAIFEERFFDFITFGAVLEHLYDPAESIESAMRWLRPGGIIQIEVPSSGHFMAKLFNLYFMMRGTNYVTNLSPMHAPFHLYEFSLESFRRHATTAGYSIAHSYFDVASIHQIPRFLHPLARAWMKRNDSGMQLTVYLRKPG
ncbi:methyltransferase family protein [Ancylobacter aquaticus]|uniref:Methyltransferase family protein n=2 Tax=Ancylobacter aquaticus TaxID=100 RepID=A0A4V6NDL4_ANCAQ|nr:methyltransferase family protein [Ancylobacter aquaticus]